MKSNNKTGIYYDTKRKKYVVSHNKIDIETGISKRTRKSFDTEADAIQYQKELEYKMGNSMFIKHNGIPLCELMRFIADKKYKTNRVAELQYSKNLETISKIEKTELSKKEISEITSEDLQNYFNTLKNYRSSYLQKFISQFTQAFKYAHSKGYISINPMSDTYIPKSIKQNRTVRALEIKEQQLLTDYLKNATINEEVYKNAFLIQLYSGLRIGEVLALQAKDIDFKNNLIHVNKTLTRNADSQVIMGNTTKTSSGIRDVPIQEIILEELKEQTDIAKNNFDTQLFVSSIGKYADSRAVNKILKRITVNIFHVNDITTHSLRHTFGTRCIEAGIAPVVVQRLLGHKDIRVTLNTYTSVLNKFKSEEFNKLNNYYQTQSITKTKDFEEGR